MGALAPGSLEGHPKKEEKRKEKRGKKRERKVKREKRKINMTNSAPFKHKQGRPGGLQGRKLQGRQIDDGRGGEGANFTPDQ